MVVFFFFKGETFDSIWSQQFSSVYLQVVNNSVREYISFYYIHKYIYILVLA